MNKNTVISVCITTFNVEPFIRECIDSVLRQRTDARLEIIIADDGSTDSTVNILKSYAASHPSLFRLLLHDHVGITENNLRAFNECSGDFVAILDGDDVWTDELKLHKSLLFLMEHPEVIFSHHNGYIVEGSQPLGLFNRESPPKLYDLKYLLEHPAVWNSSVVYRNILKGKIPSWLHTVIGHDYSLHILHAKHGMVGYIDEAMGNYRLHVGNMTRQYSGERTKEFYSATLSNIRYLKQELGREYAPLLNLMMARHYDVIAGQYWNSKQWGKFLANVLRGYLLCPVRSIKEYKDSYYHLFRQP